MWQQILFLLGNGYSVAPDTFTRRSLETKLKSRQVAARNDTEKTFETIEEPS